MQIPKEVYAYLNTLDADGLREVNRQVVTLLREAQDAKARTVIATLQVGQRVKCVCNSRVEYGTIEQIKLKKVLVRFESDNKRWNVPAQCCTLAPTFPSETPTGRKQNTLPVIQTLPVPNGLSAGQKAALTRRLRQQAAQAAGV